MSNPKPGRELDALVAEKVMGWKIEERYFYLGPEDGHWTYTLDQDRAAKDYTVTTNAGKEPWYVPQLCFNDPTDEWNDWQRVPEFSSSIGAAWEVVEKLKADGRNFKCSWGQWFLAHFSDAELPDGQPESMPHAICLAALKAVSSP